MDGEIADLARQMLPEPQVCICAYTAFLRSDRFAFRRAGSLKNYVELSSIRYPGALRLLPSCEESLHNATVCTADASELYGKHGQI